MTESRSLDVLSPGQELHWYRVDHVIGRGAFGITYLAEDINLHRPVAIKEFFPTQYCTRVSNSAAVQPISESSAEHFQWAMQRFLSEARTLAQFEHPNIVRVNNVFNENGTAYMVMNYESGISLAALLKKHGTLSEQNLTRITLPLLRGLGKVHENGFIHRDIKPANIFIRDSGTPVLLDFGSARQFIKLQTQSLTSMVSPGYAPIEQYTSNAERQGAWTDIYGLGATLFSVVTGEVPPAAVDRCEVLAKGEQDTVSKQLKKLRKSYSESLLNAIDHALAFRIEERPQSIAAWLSEFHFDTSLLDTPLDQSLLLTSIDHDTDAATDHTSTDTSKAYPPIYTPAVNDTGLSGGYREFDQDIEAPVGIRSQTHDARLYKPEDGYNEALPDLPRMTPTEPDTMPGNAEIMTPYPEGDTDPEWNKQSRHGFLYYAFLSGLLLTAGIALVGSIEAGSIYNMLKEFKAMTVQTDINSASNDPVATLEQSERKPLDIADGGQEAGLQADTETPATQEQATESAALSSEAQQNHEIAQEITDTDELLAAASADMQARRLTTPAGNNAFEKYRKVLTEDPDNHEAREGLQRIFDLYLMIAKNSLAEGKIEHAKTMLSRARKIDPDSSRLRQTRLEIEKRIKQRPSSSAFRKTTHRPLSHPIN